jgi:hypothetical protein
MERMLPTAQNILWCLFEAIKNMVYHASITLLNLGMPPSLQDHGWQVAQVSTESMFNMCNGLVLPRD